MSRQDIANLAFKITGLYCLTRAIPYLGDVLMRYCDASAAGRTILSREVWPSMLPASVPPALLAVLSYYLITRSRRLAERIFPEPQTQGPSMPALAIHSLAFSVVGIFAIVDALPEFVVGVMTVALRWRHFFTWQSYGGAWTLIAPYTVGPIVKLALGIGLFLGSHRLVRIWSRLRSSDLRRQLGLCNRCGYDLTGNTSGTCPECGTTISTSDMGQNKRQSRETS